MILGTAAYMSPEQARGQTVDKRTDIWAFGCVLYEMLTGRTAFGGATMVDTLGAVLNQEPDWTALPDSLPAAVRRLLRRCLEKDPKRRLHDIADARIELDDARDDSVAPQASVDAPRSRRRTLALVVVLGLGTLALAGVMYLPRVTPDVPTVRMTILPPPGVSTAARGTPAQHIAISPDGRRLAFAAADENGRIALWVRPLDQLEAHALPGTDDANYPFWSPDSRSIAFFAQGKLKRIDATGGAVNTLCDAGQAAFAIGRHLESGWRHCLHKPLSGQQTGRIYRVSAAGGERALVRRLTPRTVRALFIAVLPARRPALSLHGRADCPATGWDLR